MSESSIWWLLAGAAVAVELMTGTLYLLMLAIGISAGAIAAYLGLAVIGQMLVAAAIGGLDGPAARSVLPELAHTC